MLDEGLMLVECGAKLDILQLILQLRRVFSI